MREERNPLRLVLWAGLAAFGAVLAAKSFPELRRYLRMRRM